MRRREFYDSSNGDKWFLVQDEASGDVFVRHMPNIPSGGQPSEIHLSAFLSKNKESPERQHLMALITTLISDTETSAG